MGHACSVALPPLPAPSGAAKPVEEDGTLSSGIDPTATASLACRSYNGPFRVKGLNANAFESEYAVGKHYSDKVFTASNKVTGMMNVAYRLPKIESPCNDPKAMLSAVRDLQQIDHCNICKLFEAFDDPGFVILVYQQLTARPLFTALKEKAPSHAFVADMSLQLLRAVNAASLAKLCHGALTPKNILSDSVGKIVVINYGLVDVLRQDPMHKVDKAQLGYLAPESLSLWSSRQRKSHKARLVALHPWERLHKSTEADLWSIGVITFQLLSGKMPYTGRGMAETARHILHHEVDFSPMTQHEVRPEATDFVRQILVRDPSRRTKTATLLQHQWFKQVSSFHTEERDKPVSSHILENLISHHHESEFKKAIMRYTAETIPARKLRKLQDEFSKLDKTGDGFVSISELKEELKKHPDFRHRVNELDTAFNEIGGADGLISLQEFIVATVDTQLVLLETLLWEAFQKIDKDHSGAISKHELRDLLQELGGGGRLSKSHIDEMIMLIDEEVSDEITFQQFTDLVREEGGQNRRRIVRTVEKLGQKISACGHFMHTNLRACTATMSVGDPHHH